MTISEIVQNAIPQLTEAGVDSPRLDAELLLARVLGRRRSWLWTYPVHEVSERQCEEFRALLARRLKREPLAYILGEWEFYGRPFEVTPDVLVPRPETELLVEEVLRWVRAYNATRGADIGVGSGAIAVALTAEDESLHIFAVDISLVALDVARRNAISHKVEERIEFIQGDLIFPLLDQNISDLDFIAANLPYISTEERAGLMPEVRDFEPESALFAGQGGLAEIKRLIEQAPRLLRPGGLLALELGLGQSERVARLLAENGWSNIRTVQDYGGIARHVLAESPSTIG